MLCVMKVTYPLFLFLFHKAVMTIALMDTEQNQTNPSIRQIPYSILK
jgi:hypothetical protein